MSHGIKFVPLTPQERSRLLAQIEGRLCRSCELHPPWSKTADVCAECEIRLTAGVIALWVHRANERQAERLIGIAARTASA